jgi:hypothetical protein
MSAGEAKAVRNTSYLRGGNSGETFFTKDLYKSSLKADDRLSLPNPSTVRLEFRIENNPKMTINGNKVAPVNGKTGGGSEFMTKNKVKVSVINEQPIKK